MCKLLFAGVLSALLCVACKDADTYRIKVDLDNLAAQKLYAVFESPDRKMVDTLIYDGSGRFTIEKQVQEGTRTLTLITEDRTKQLTVYLESAKTISITGDAQLFAAAEVSGGKINDRLSAFKKEAQPLLKELTLLSEAEQNPIAGGHTTAARIANIQQELISKAETFIKKNPADAASAILIETYFSDPDDPTKMDELLAVLDKSLDDFYVVKALREYNRRVRQTMVGVRIPTFEVRNLYDESYTDRSFEGRYLILAFTALWCDMCQPEKSYLEEVIKEQQPDKGPEILLISLDEDPQEVRDQMKNESIRWNVVTDSIGQATNMFDRFNVRSLPYFLLVDTAGIIRLKTGSGIELTTRLRDSGLLPATRTEQ